MCINCGRDFVYISVYCDKFAWFVCKQSPYGLVNNTHMFICLNYATKFLLLCATIKKNLVQHRLNMWMSFVFCDFTLNSLPKQKQLYNKSNYKFERRHSQKMHTSCYNIHVNEAASCILLLRQTILALTPANHVLTECYTLFLLQTDVSAQLNVGRREIFNKFATKKASNHFIHTKPSPKLQ